MRFDGKIAIVTGAGTGIGEAISHKFAQEGAPLALAGLPDDPMEDVAAPLFPAAFTTIGLSDPVADRLRGWFEFARKVLRIASGANQLDHLAPEFRRIGQTGLGHGDTLGSKLQAIHEGGAIPPAAAAER